jgi:acyl-CoA dehydrogenase
VLRTGSTRFLCERRVPDEASIVETDAIPPAIIGEVNAPGLGGPSIPEEYGCIGLTEQEEVEGAPALGQASRAT